MSARVLRARAIAKEVGSGRPSVYRVPYVDPSGATIDGFLLS
jgi:hypothetical protein